MCFVVCARGRGGGGNGGGGGELSAKYFVTRNLFFRDTSDKCM